MNNDSHTLTDVMSKAVADAVNNVFVKYKEKEAAAVEKARQEKE